MAGPSQISLNNGVELPTLGLSVFQSRPPETVAAVEAAMADRLAAARHRRRRRRGNVL
jgi:hypothetical protein